MGKGVASHWRAARSLAWACGAALAIATIPSPAPAAPGDLDVSFGEGGIVITGIGSSDYVADLAIQPDGKILAAGMTWTMTGGRFALARYSSDGILDPDFGTGGWVVPSFEGIAHMQALALALAPDGKIVLAGIAESQEGDASLDFAIVRFNNDGTVDSDFGSDGLVKTWFIPVNDEVATGVAVQADGKIVVVGTNWYAGIPAPLWNVETHPGEWIVARYNLDGTPDDSFGLQGRVTTEFGADQWAVPMNVEVLADGKILTGGSAGWSYWLGTKWDFALARYNPDGSLDPSFGNEGKATADFFQDVDFANGMAIYPDGRIALVGTALLQSCADGFLFAYARFTADGSLDPTFGTRTRNFGWGGWDQAFDCAVQPDGKLVAVGMGDDGEHIGGLVVVTRLDLDGTPDPSFGIDGLVSMPASDWWYGASAVAIHPNGSIIVAGWADPATGGESGAENFALIGYEGLERSTGVPGTPVPPAGLRLSVGPNPAAGSVAIVVQGADPSSPLTVEVFDVEGRRVRAWSQRVGADSTRLTWDGSTADGRQVGSGIYIVRATTPGTSAVTRVAFMK